MKVTLITAAIGGAVGVALVYILAAADLLPCSVVGRALVIGAAAAVLLLVVVRSNRRRSRLGHAARPDSST